MLDNDFSYLFDGSKMDNFIKNSKLYNYLMLRDNGKKQSKFGHWNKFKENPNYLDIQDLNLL